MTSSITSSASQSISTVVFGITATVIGAITVWQSYRAWRIWYESGAEPDIELGLASSGERSNEAVAVLPPTASGGPPEDNQADHEPAVVATRSHPSVSRDNDDGPSSACSRIGDHHTEEEPEVLGFETGPSVGRDSSSTKSCNNQNNDDAGGTALGTHSTTASLAKSGNIHTEGESIVTKEAGPAIDGDNVGTGTINDEA